MMKQMFEMTNLKGADDLYRFELYNSVVVGKDVV